MNRFTFWFSPPRYAVSIPIAAGNDPPTSSQNLLSSVIFHFLGVCENAKRTRRRRRPISQMKYYYVPVERSEGWWEVSRNCWKTLRKSNEEMCLAPYLPFLLHLTPGIRNFMTSIHGNLYRIIYSSSISYFHFSFYFSSFERTKIRCGYNVDVLVPWRRKGALKVVFLCRKSGRKKDVCS